MNDENQSVSDKIEQILREGSDPWTGAHMRRQITAAIEQRMLSSQPGASEAEMPTDRRAASAIIEDVVADLHDYLHCLGEIQRTRFFVACAFGKRAKTPHERRMANTAEGFVDLEALVPEIARRLVELERSQESSSPLVRWACDQASRAYGGCVPHEAPSLSTDKATGATENTSCSYCRHCVGDRRNVAVEGTRPYALELDEEGYFHIREADERPPPSTDLANMGGEDESVQSFLSSVFRPL